MKKIGKKVNRVLSLVLAIVMIVTMIPSSAVSVYGEELNEEALTEANVDIADETETETDIEEVEIIEEDIDELPCDDSEELFAEDISEEAMSLQNENTTITLDANGGTMKLDAKALNVEGATEDGRCEKQSFYYESRSINEDERYVADTSCQKWQSAQSWEAAEYIEEFNNAFVPTYEGHCFEGWYDDSEEYYSYTFPDNNDRTYHAKWSLDLDSIIPNLDSYFGIDDGDGFDGIQFSQEGRNVYYSFQIKQEDYKDIEVGEDEELKLYVQHGAKRPIAGNNDNIYIDENDYYKIKEPAYTVDVD